MNDLSDLQKDEVLLPITKFISLQFQLSRLRKARDYLL
jgi:hypothetical protein